MDLVVGSLLNAEDPRVDIVVKDAAGQMADEWATQSEQMEQNNTPRPRRTLGYWLRLLRLNHV